MGSQNNKGKKDISKQLLLALLFILACTFLSIQINRSNRSKDSGIPYENGIHIVSATQESVNIGKDLVFVPNIDYEDIDSGAFTYDNYEDLPYASNVSVTYGGWNDLGDDVVWHNSIGMPEARQITRDGKVKNCGTYLMTIRFEDPDMTYYMSIPDSNGLIKVYCNNSDLGFLWRRTGEWNNTLTLGYSYVPIIPDADGTARIMISISTNVKIYNPGMLAMPSFVASTSAMKLVVFPALWTMIQLILFLFILIGGLLISRTFKNKLIFYLLIALELLALSYTLIDSNFIVVNSYTKALAKFVLFIALNSMVFIYIDSYFVPTDKQKKSIVLNTLPVIVVASAVILIVWAIISQPEFNLYFPLVPEIIFVMFVAILTGFNMVVIHYGEDWSFFASIIEISQIFFSVNAINDIKGIYNIPTYSVFMVIANLTLEFYFISRYVIQARKLEDTMERMQFLVHEKTMRISEINKDLFNTNKKLMENEQARKNVLSNVSHDLRTPITAIRGYAEMILSSGDRLTDSQKENYLRNIIRRSEQMERIISDIVELTRLESDATEFQFTDLSISELLDEICIMYEADLEGTSKQLILDIPENDLLFVKADPKKLSRVFENLISNAINYTYEEAKITVKAWREGADKDLSKQTINIDIEDNGIGIPEAEIPMVFDRFYRAKNSGKNIKGTGIGLSIVKTIIDRHDAKISVESEIGKGTVFHIIMKPSYRES